MLEIWEEFSAGFGQELLVFSVLFAVLLCFLGYRLLKVWIMVMGFAVGFTAGFSVAALLTQGDINIPVIAGIVVGILLALLAFKLYLAGVFLLCGVSAFGAVQALSLPASADGGVMPLVLGVAAFVVVGILAVKLARPCIILVTAISGAVNAVHSLSASVELLSENELLLWAVVAVLAVLGVVVQFKTTK